MNQTPQNKPSRTNDHEKCALLLVDVQNDFMPGGALEVANGDEIIPVISQLITLPFDFILASKDWHPKNHVSFAHTHHKKPGEVITVGSIDQILWPIHCVENTPGAEFYPGWNTAPIQKIFFKGTDPEIDSYSAFFDNGRNKSTGLADYLKKNKIKKIFIAGLTTEYCVKYSAIDAISLGFDVYVIADACRGVNLHPNDAKNSLKAMEQAGSIVISSDEVEKWMRKKR
jgi:nicotinamidase/pyrazinamidase